MNFAEFNDMGFDPENVYSSFEDNNYDHNHNHDHNDQDNQYEPTPSGYKTTGAQIPITKDELLYGVIDQLRQYDDLARRNQPTTHNPYQEPILYTTSNGQSVQVPSQIQQEAIQDWVQQRQILDQARQQENTRLKQTQPPTQESKSKPQSLSLPPRTKPLPSQPQSSQSSSSSYVLWILIGIVIIYLIYTHKK